MSVNGDIADGLTARRLRLLRFEGDAAARTVAIYEQAIADLERALDRVEQKAANGGAVDQRSAAALRAETARLDRRLREVRGALQEELQRDLATVATVEAAQTVAVLSQATTGLAIAWQALPPAAALNAIGAEWSDVLDTKLFTVRREVTTQLASAYARGLGVDASVAELRRVQGVLAAPRSSLVTLVRTEFQRVANEAAMATYQANADVIGGIQYLATLDLRTCPLCGPQHRRVYVLTADGPSARAPTLPRHPRCRCFYAPVTRSWEELGLTGLSFNQRRGLDGRAGAADTFEGWLRRQPTADQVEALGAWRYEAWRGGAALGSFSVGDRLLTREQFAADAA